MSNIEEKRVIIFCHFLPPGHGAVLHMSSVRKQPEDADFSCSRSHLDYGFDHNNPSHNQSCLDQNLII